MFFVFFSPTKSTKIDVNALLQAIKECLTYKRPIKSTATSHGFPRSTLQRYLKKFENEFEEISSVEDDMLMDFARECYHYCFWITTPHIYRLGQSIWGLNMECTCCCSRPIAAINCSRWIFLCSAQ